MAEPPGTPPQQAPSDGDCHSKSPLWPWFTDSAQKRLQKRMKRVEAKKKWFQAQRDWYRYPHIRLQYFKKKQKQREQQHQQRRKNAPVTKALIRKASVTATPTSNAEPTVERADPTTSELESNADVNQEEDEPDFDSMSYSQIVFYAMEKRLRRPGPTKFLSLPPKAKRVKKKEKKQEGNRNNDSGNETQGTAADTTHSSPAVVKKRRPKRRKEERAPKKMPHVIKNTSYCNPVLKTKLVKYGKNYEQEESDWGSD